MSRDTRAIVVRHSCPECQVLIFVFSQSYFSFIGRQSLTNLSHISRTFWLTETKLRRIQTGSRHPRRLRDYFERKSVLRIVLIFQKDCKFQQHVSESLRLMRGNWEHLHMFRDILETPSWMPFAICHQQLQPSEIGALDIYSAMYRLFRKMKIMENLWK